MRLWTEKELREFLLERQVYDDELEKLIRRTVMSALAIIDELRAELDECRKGDR